MAIAGNIPKEWPYKAWLKAGQIRSSLTIKLIALVGIFIALPVVLYGQFEQADRQIRDLVAESLQHRGALIAQALTPVLEHGEDPADPAINAALEKFAEDGNILKLMYRPALKSGAANFYFIASAPHVAADQTGPDLDILNQHGILKSLSDSCSWDKPVEIRYPQINGAEEIVTSIIPIKGRFGCWALISANDGSVFVNSAFGRPYWQTDNVRMAALIYLVFALLAGLIAISVRRALHRFRTVAREIRRGGSSTAAFASRNILPELASAATDFDRLVEDLRHAASDIRRTAEENAHAVKAPLATIRSALQPLRRAIAPDDQRSQRAVYLIDSALQRLATLISTAQRMGNDTADFIEAPKLRINLTNIVGEALRNARDISTGKNIRFIRHLDENVHVLAPTGILDVIVENILDNAISFSDINRTITTTLTRSARRVDLKIEDEGPGIDPAKIERIFDRNFSSRPADDGPIDEPDHAGLGLWIVKRHAEALGGEALATNRPNGGLCVHVSLPSNGW